jgi:hypothetical protein
MMQNSSGLLCLLFPTGLIALYFIWLAIDSSNREKVRHHVESTGGEYIEASRAGSEPGRTGYRVHYLDWEGNEHEVVAWTGPMSGVGLKGDRVIRFAKHLNEDLESLQEQIHRLRDELAILKRTRRQEMDTGIQQSCPVDQTAIQ